MQSICLRESICPSNTCSENLSEMVVAPSHFWRSFSALEHSIASLGSYSPFFLFHVFWHSFIKILDFFLCTYLVYGPTYPGYPLNISWCHLHFAVRPREISKLFRWPHRRLFAFLDATSHLYKRVCPSVGPERLLSDACKSHLMQSIRPCCHKCRNRISIASIRGSTYLSLIASCLSLAAALWGTTAKNPDEIFNFKRGWFDFFTHSVF